MLCSCATANQRNEAKKIPPVRGGSDLTPCHLEKRRIFHPKNTDRGSAAKRNERYHETRFFSSPPPPCNWGNARFINANAVKLISPRQILTLLHSFEG